MDTATHNLFQAVIEVLFGIIVAGGTWYLKRLGNRVDRVETDLRKYETDVGVGHAKLETLHTLIQSHMDREEDQLKQLNVYVNGLNVQLASISTKLEAIGIAATTEYARIAVHERESEEWKQRIVRLETRLEKVENGSK